MKAIKPLYEVFRVVDSKRYVQMSFLYYMMERTKKQISKNDPKHAQEFINIIEHHWDYQMSRDLHLVGKHGFKNIINIFSYASKNILNQS